MAAILLVDDDLEFLRLAGSVLELVGHHEVTCASSGVEALKKLDKSVPDLIVTDVIMPHMNGWDLVSRLKSGPAADVPVIFTSALGDDVDARIRGLQLGAEDFLRKPIAPEELLLIIDRRLTREYLVAEVTEPSLLPDADLRGRIGRLGLASIMGMLEMERRSGVLVVDTNEAVIYMVLQHGNVIRAGWRGERVSDGQQAVFTALDTVDGEYEFAEHDTSGPVELGQSVGSLLLEHARQRDEGERA